MTYERGATPVKVKLLLTISPVNHHPAMVLASAKTQKFDDDVTVVRVDLFRINDAEHLLGREASKVREPMMPLKLIPLVPPLS